MNVTHRNVVKEAMNSEFLTMIQSDDMSIPGAYKRLIEQNTYALMTSVSLFKSTKYLVNIFLLIFVHVLG